ncbi:MAG: oligopeptide/dipeptide transporter, ATPase subunit [Enterovirga sp.]|nr:oligopeptide/dipeptide transporter, ATPase subunit [Enterovirga sp.]
MTRPLLEVNDLVKHYGGKGALVRAVDGVSFHVDRGETLSLVGESGCGKSTVGRAVLRLVDLTGGQVVLDGQRIDALSAGALRPLRRRMQVVFQDPFSSLNPRMRVRDILAEPIRNFALATSGPSIEERVAKLLDTVRLPRDAAAASRTNSPAGSGSASASPGRSRRSRTSSSATRRCRRSTSRSRRRSSICCKTCSAIWASPFCSSRTTSPSSST